MEMITTLIILGVSVVLFFSGAFPLDLIALLTAVALGISGLLTPQEALSGFSRASTITILAICVVAEALERAGLTAKMGSLLVRVGKTGERGTIVAVSVCAATLSLLMNNIAAASLLLPAVSEVSRRSGVSISRLGIPLAFGTLLGGMATLFTTSNLVVSAILRDNHLEGFGVFDFLPVGGPAAIAGILFLAFFGPRLLPAQSPIEQQRNARQEQVDLVEAYHLGTSLRKYKVEAGCPLANTPLSKTDLWHSDGVRVVGILHRGGALVRPSGAAVLAPGDSLVLQGERNAVASLASALGLGEIAVAEWREGDLMSQSDGVCEVVLSPRSSLLGKSLLEVRFRERYGFSVLAIWRGPEQLVSNYSQIPLQFGDALLVQGPYERTSILSSDPDFIVLGTQEKVPILPLRRRIAAIVLCAATLVWAGFDHDRAAEVLLLGALAMVVFKVMTMEDVYRAIEWRTVFMVAGMLPMGIAVTKTGLGTELGTIFAGQLGDFGPMAIVMAFMILAVALTQFMGGPAVAVIMAPIAVQTASSAGIDPRALCMAVTVSTSMAFFTPIGHPVNVLVMGPGGYRFRDFARIGLPLSLVVTAVVAAMLPVVFPLR